VVAVLAPILGALADQSGIRKRLLAIFMLVGVGSCVAMSFIGEGDLAFASAVFFIGNIGVSASLVFYDSLLPAVARPDETDRVSSAGYAMGYVGGGLMLVVNLAWIQMPSAFGFSSSAEAVKASFLAVGLWWAVFAIPLFRRVPEPSFASEVHGVSAAAAVAAAFGRLGATFREIRRHRNAFMLFIAMLLYQDGIQTIIRLAGVFGAEAGIPLNAQVGAFVMVQFVATLLGYRMQTTTDFFVLAALIATVQGGAQALSRALFARLIPADQTSEFFGFFAVAERFATVLGPAVVTLSITLTGSARSAILAILLFFVAGAFVLSRVDDRATRVSSTT
jgi:UMF1 family MFS transporter